MMRWHVKSLGDPMLADDGIEQLTTAFRRAHADSGSPKEMAVFIRHESEGQLHCEVKVYFAPAAARFAQDNGGTPCMRPSLESLSLLAGPEGSWDLLFPERET